MTGSPWPTSRRWTRRWGHGPTSRRSVPSSGSCSTRWSTTSPRPPLGHRLARRGPPLRGFVRTASPLTTCLRSCGPDAPTCSPRWSTSRGTQHVWTTFSADQVDLDYREPRVLLAVTEVLLDYLRHGATMLRLDAVAFLWKEAGTDCIHRAPDARHRADLAHASSTRSPRDAHRHRDERAAGGEPRLPRAGRRPGARHLPVRVCAARAVGLHVRRCSHLVRWASALPEMAIRDVGPQRPRLPRRHRAAAGPGPAAPGRRSRGWSTGCGRTGER
jgi:hypothetical protein